MAKVRRKSPKQPKGVSKKAVKKLNTRMKQVARRQFGKPTKEPMAGGGTRGYATTGKSNLPGLKVKPLTTKQGRKNTKASYKQR